MIAAALGRRSSSATSSLSSSVSTSWTPASDGPASCCSKRGHRSAMVTTRYGRWTNAGSSPTSSWPKTVRKPCSARAAASVIASRRWLRGDQREVVEPEDDPARVLADREPPVAADVGPDLASSEVDAKLGRRTLEDHPV